MVVHERPVLEGHSLISPPKRQKFRTVTDADKLHPRELLDFQDMHSRQFDLGNLGMLRRSSSGSFDSSFSSYSDSDSNDSDNDNLEIESRITHKDSDDIVSPSSTLNSVGLSQLGELCLSSINFEFRDNLSNQTFQLHSSRDKITDSIKGNPGSCSEGTGEERKLMTMPVDKCGNTELHLRIRNKDETGALEIIQKARGFEDLNVSNKFGQTPMHLAVITGQENILRKLICAGGLVSEVDNDGNTPLHLASSSGCLDLVRHLLKPIQYDETIENEYNIPFQAIPQDLAAENEDRFSCIELAAYNGHFDVLNELEDV